MSGRFYFFSAVLAGGYPAKLAKESGGSAAGTP